MAFGDVTNQGATHVDATSSLSHSFTGGTPTSGNLLVACLATGGLNTATTPSGWSVAYSQEYNGNDQFSIIYYKISAGNETSVAWSNLNSGEEHSVCVMEFEGPFQSSPLDEATGAYNASSQSSIDPGPTGTLAQAEEIAVAMAWNWNGDELDSWSIDDGFTEEFEEYNSLSLMMLVGWDLTAATTAKDPTITFGSADGSDGSYGSTAAIATFMSDTGTDYDETGRSVSITATIAATDALTRVETGRSVAITASVAATDIATRNEAGRTVSIAASVAATDALTLGELGRSVSISSSVAATDLADFTEDLGTAITSSVTATDQWDATDDVAVSVDATVTGIDQADFTEALTVSVTATVTGVDDLTHYDDVLVAIVATVAATDDYAVDSMNISESVLYFVEIPTGTNYDETGRVVTVTSSVAATDQWDATDDLTVTIAATIAGTDSHGFYDLALSVSVLATVTGTDRLDLIDTCTVSVTSNVTATDDHNIAYTENVAVAITSSVVATDDRTLTDENCAVSVTSNLFSTDQHDMLEAIVVAVTSVVQGSDQLTTPGAYEENRSVAIISTATSTDTADFTEAGTVAATGTVEATDAWSTSEAVSVSVIATVAATDDHNIVYSESVSVAISSSVTPTDQFDATEAVAVAVVGSSAASDAVSSVEALSVPVTATVNATDSETEGYGENVTVAIVSTVTAVDTAAWFDATTLNPPVYYGPTSDITVIGDMNDDAPHGDGDGSLYDELTNPGRDRYVEIPMIGASDTAAGYFQLPNIEDPKHDAETYMVIDLTHMVAIDIGGTAITGSFVLRQGDTSISTQFPSGNGDDWRLNEIELTPAQTAGITDWNDLNVAISFVAGSNHVGTDLVKLGFIGIRIPTAGIIATVVATDGLSVTETAVVAATATVTATDQWTRYEDALVAITSAVASTDLFTLGEIVSIEIISAIVTDDIGAFVDASVVPVQSTVGSWDNWYMLLEHDTAGIGTASGETEPNRAVSDDELADAVGGERGTATSNLPRPGRVT